MSITADLVKELRERTGAAMMDCKRALVDTKGNIDEAIELMRKSGAAKADKKSSRVAAEGLIQIAMSADHKHAIMLEVNCETDFVARDESFLAFSKQAADVALANKINDVTKLAAQTISGSSETIEHVRQQLVAKIGENITLRRIYYISSDDATGSYLHGTRIGVLITMKGGDMELRRDLAMHIAANIPMVISPDQVPANVIEKEREIFSAQAQSSGKPADIIEKMVQGRIKKFLDEVSLVGQPFVKNPDITVAKLLAEKNATVISFVRFAVGEGIEKQVTNFAEEVMAQVRGS